MSNQDVDTKKKSASEAFVNSFGAYPIGYGVGIIILPLSMGWIQDDPLVANLLITFVYATVSFTRSYALRRIFEKYGIDDNFLRLGIKQIKKIPLWRFRNWVKNDFVACVEPTNLLEELMLERNIIVIHVWEKSIILAWITGNHAHR